MQPCPIFPMFAAHYASKSHRLHRPVRVRLDRVDITSRRMPLAMEGAWGRKRLGVTQFSFSPLMINRLTWLIEGFVGAHRGASVRSLAGFWGNGRPDPVTPSKSFVPIDGGG